jgi:hypothetical protein
MNDDDRFPPYQRGSDTSHNAAGEIHAKAPTLRALVFDRIKASGGYGMTDDEIQIALGMLLQTETARRNELLNAGAIVDSGKRRKTRHGRPAVVWIEAPLKPVSEWVQPTLML